MNRFFTLARAAVLLSTLVGAAAFADPMPLSVVITASDPVEKGRPSRNGLPQDFDGTEPFPGFINPTLSYHFHPYTINVGLNPYVTITFDSLSPNTFLSAYQSAYYVTAPQTTWLGDAGTSGNYFGTDPLSFSFIAAINSTVVLILNETTPNAGLNYSPALVYAQLSSDRDYDNTVDVAITSGGQVIPEPATLALFGAPLVGLALVRRRRAKGAALAA